MRNVLHSLILATLVAGASATLVTLSPTVTAQTPKDKAKVDPKADPKVDPKADPKTTPKTEAKGSVVYRADKQGKFRFFIQDESGKTLAQSSVGYETKEDCLKMIETVKALLNNNKPKEDK